MKTCAYCKIEVGGNLKKCPFCQSTLSGEGERDYFPATNILKIGSFFYRLQLFIVLSLVIICLGMDFMLHMQLLFDFHWSLLVTMWALVFEFVILRIFKKGWGTSRTFTMFCLILLVLALFTIYYVDRSQVRFMLYWVVPVVLMVTQLVNFIFTMLDKSGNAMIYLLCNLLVGIIPYLVCRFSGRDCPVAWIICLLASTVMLIGTIIFKGRAVGSELERRLNL